MTSAGEGNFGVQSINTNMVAQELSCCTAVYCSVGTGQLDCSIVRYIAVTVMCRNVLLLG